MSRKIVLIQLIKTQKAGAVNILMNIWKTLRKTFILISNMEMNRSDKIINKWQLMIMVCHSTFNHIL